MPTTVLVVDDNPDSILIMTRMLEFEGFKVTVATGGADALEKVRRQPPDLILLDVMMPEMGGLEVLQQLKGDLETRKIPVILVTARQQDEHVMQGYQYGADYYIPKPFTGKQLLYGVQLVLEKHDVAS